MKTQNYVDDETIGRILAGNLWEFHQRVLQWDNPHNKMGGIHRRLCSIMDGMKEHRRAMILLPRGHLKSATVTVGWTIQQVCKDPNIRVLIGSETNAKAKDFLRQIRDVFEKNERVRYLYGDHVRKTSRWTDDEITSALRTSTSIKEPTVFTTGTDQTRTGAHCDIAILDDPVSHTNINTKEAREKTLKWYREIANNILDPGGLLVVIGCLTADSKVLMANGSWKPIVDVRSGEMVKSFYKKTFNAGLGEAEYRKAVDRKVEAMIPQGEADVFDVSLGNYSLKGTANHPFLVIEGTKTVWKKLEELEIGDKVVTMQQMATDSSIRDMDGKMIRDKDYWWFLGFMMGDGWVIKSKKRRHGFAFALGVDEKMNERAKKIAEKWFGSKGVRKDNGQMRFEDARASRFLEKMGIKGGAKHKRLPWWLYHQRKSHRREFIRGILDADGYKQRGNIERIELANEHLIGDLYWLAMTSGVRVTGIYSRERLIQPPNSPEPVLAKTWSLGLNYKRRQKAGVNFGWERVERIDYVGKQPVYDLTVEGEHNFIANGMVVHNTRWHFADIYQYILDEQADVFKIFHHQALTDDAYDILRSGKTLAEKEKLITDDVRLFPEKFTVQQLLEIYNGNSVEFFNNQYMNKIVDSETADFREQDIQFYEPGERLPYMNKYIGIDPAISEEGDYTAIMCVGITQENKWYILEYENIHAKPNEIISQTFDMHKRHDHEIRKIGIETAAYQKALVYGFRDEMRKTGVKLPLVEVSRGGRGALTKEQRILSLQPIVSQKRLHIQKGMVELRDQLRSFPRSKYDDLLDSLAVVNEVAVGFKRSKEYDYKNETREQRDDRLAQVATKGGHRSSVTNY